MNPFAKMKTALIGCGMISDIYLENGSKTFNILDVVGCSDIKPERSAAKADKFGIRFAPVGTGNLNWPGILKTAEAIGIERYVIEQDIVDGDVFTAIQTSVDNLKKMGLA